jgi:glucarate dehydratase
LAVSRRHRELRLGGNRELGVAAAAAHHVVLTLPNGVEGHQQTAQLLQHDVLVELLPIATGPRWGPIDRPGLGIEVDDDAVAEAAARYRADGQYVPWQDHQLAKEER